MGILIQHAARPGGYEGRKDFEMKIQTVSKVGHDGASYIVIEVKEPIINERDLWCGGLMLDFKLDHVKQTTKLYKFSYVSGVPSGFLKCIKTWKDEILTPEECLEYAKTNFRNLD